MYSSYGGVSSRLQSFGGTWLITYFLKSILPQRHKMSLFFLTFQLSLCVDGCFVYMHVSVLCV